MRPASNRTRQRSLTRTVSRRRRAGFSLIEALVALTILAAVGGSATALFALAGERDARATARLRAVLAAESPLARVGLGIAARAPAAGTDVLLCSRRSKHSAPDRMGDGEGRDAPCLASLPACPIGYRGHPPWASLGAAGHGATAGPPQAGRAASRGRSRPAVAR